MTPAVSDPQTPSMGHPPPSSGGGGPSTTFVVTAVIPPVLAVVALLAWRLPRDEIAHPLDR